MQAAIVDGIEDAFDARIEAMRGEFAGFSGLLSDVEVIFSASGTDAQLQALYLGRALLGASLTTLIVAADQTGSGTVFTARGQHFGDHTANDDKVVKGAPLDGLAQPVDCIALPLRNDAGEIRPRPKPTPWCSDGGTSRRARRSCAASGDGLLEIGMARAQRRLAAGHHRALAGSGADRDRRLPDAAIAAADRRYLDRGFMVLVTGSKYFTGPPFCGALLVRRLLAADRCDRLDLAGLAAYNSASDWPRDWGPPARSFRPDRISANGCAGKPRSTKSTPTTPSRMRSGARRCATSAKVSRA